MGVEFTRPQLRSRTRFAISISNSPPIVLLFHIVPHPHLIPIVVADFTSVNSFQEDLKFTSPSFYNLTPPPPPTSRPPTYDVQNYQTPTNTPNGTIPAENYYAATDIIKVFDKLKRFSQIRIAHDSGGLLGPDTVTSDRIINEPDDLVVIPD